LSAMTEFGHLIPLCVCELLRSIRGAAEKKLPAVISERAVSSLFFLRVLNPALCGAGEMTDRRSVILLSKLLQALANGVHFGEKEDFLLSFNPWLSASRPVLNSFVFDCVFAIRKVNSYFFLIFFIFFFLFLFVRTGRKRGAILGATKWWKP
jgi:hypothetical protein